MGPGAVALDNCLFTVLRAGHVMSAIREDVGRIYITFMEEVKVQHNALADTLESIVDEAEGQQMLEAEFAYLQVRRICELLALAVIAAHNRLPEARSRSFFTSITRP
jgi:hypothetical protein